MTDAIAVMCGAMRLPVLVLAGVQALLGGVLPASADAGRELHVFTWSDYVDPALVSVFEAQNDVTVRFSYFGSAEQRDTELASSDRHGFDLIMMNDTRIAASGRRGWLAPIDRDLVPETRHVDPRWADAVSGSLIYGVPYLRGTLGIGWREDLVVDAIDSWGDLLDPVAELEGRIFMSDDPRELVGVALKAGGHSANDASSAALREAEKRLWTQRPAVGAYRYPSLSDKSSLVTGDVVAGMMYSGDVRLMQEHTPSIRYSLPTEGGIIWVDYLTVAAASRNQVLAHAFIDFLNRPANAAQLAEFLYYATPNMAAEKLLPRSLLDDPIIYPDADALVDSELLGPLPPRSKKRVNSIGAALARR